MEKLFNTLRAILLLVLLVTYSVLIDTYPLFKLNVIIGGSIIAFWAFSGEGFAYVTSRNDAPNRLTTLHGHFLKNGWAVLLGIVTAFCFPIGLALSKLYFCFLVKKDGTFTRKFYLFFEPEKSWLL